MKGDEYIRRAQTRAHTHAYACLHACSNARALRANPREIATIVPSQCEACQSRPQSERVPREQERALLGNAQGRGAQATAAAACANVRVLP